MTIVLAAGLCVAILLVIHWRDPAALADQWSFALQLVATGVGVLVAFELERQLDVRREGKAEEARQNGLREYLAALTSNVSYNLAVLDRIAVNPSNATDELAAAAHDLPIELWRASAPRLTDLGAPAQLVADLAMFYHFASSARELLMMQVAHHAGRRAYAMAQVNQARTQGREILQRHAAWLPAKAPAAP